MSQCFPGIDAYLGRTLYLLNHVEQTSAASSLSPIISAELEGVGWVSTAQLEPVTDADVEKGEKPSSTPARPSCLLG
jgi:hypothetical protein